MKKILIVDDDIEIQNLLKVYLKNKYELTVASHGKEALDLLRASPNLPDLIVLDIEMPVMSGTVLKKELSADQRLKDLPIIYLTAKNQMHDNLEHAFKFDFLNKPIQKDDLLFVLESFFRIHSAE